MGRLFDLFAVLGLAIVLLLPKASLHAKPALLGNKVELDRIALLEDALHSDPNDTGHGIELADAYLRLGHADWALATLKSFVGRRDHRVHLLRATCHAERLEAADAIAEYQMGLRACDSEPAPQCGETDRIRLNVVAAPMQALLDAHVDAKKEPQRARQIVSTVLRATKASNASPTKKQQP